MTKKQAIQLFQERQVRTIWGATQGVAYTDAILRVGGKDSIVTFSEDKMIGKYDTPAIWTKSDNVEQLIPIHQNWNWIAFGVEPQSAFLDKVFGAYAEWSMIIKNRTAYDDDLQRRRQLDAGECTDTDCRTLQGFKIGRKPTHPGVYIHHGKKVLIKLKK